MNSNIYRSRRDVRLSGPDNPTIATVAEVKDTYRNTTTYELFTCVDVVGGDTYWKGTQGTEVPVVVDPILLPTHPNLVAMYTMDNTVGSTLIDETNNGNGLTQVGLPIFEQGIISNSLKCTTSDYYTSSDLTLVNTIKSPNICFSFWVDTTDPSNNADLIGIFNSVSNRRATVGYISTLGAVVVVDDSSTFKIYKTNVEPIGWSHFVIQEEVGVKYCYTNGSKTQLVLHTGSGIGWFDDVTATSFGVGGGNSNGSLVGTGGLDQVRLFNRILTQQEITTLYNEGTP